MSLSINEIRSSVGIDHKETSNEPNTENRINDKNNINECNPDKFDKLSPKRDFSWPSVLFLIHLYILGLYGITVLFSNTCFTTVIFTTFLICCGCTGVTCGAHRLWAHHSYKADNMLKIFLMLCQTMAGQGCIYDWVRKHRLHHKLFKKPDDPMYSDKNFFHGHIITQIKNLSPRQEAMLDEIDVSDLEEDKIVMFQKRYYWLLYAICFILLPVNAPMEYWGDSVQASIFVVFSLRYLIILNVSWLVNSAHFIWGMDPNFKPSDSNLIFIITKSYWPQYHYLLPFDYQSDEFGSYGSGCSTVMIRVFAALGIATDLKTITSEAVKNGLSRAVDTGRSIVECLTECGLEEMEKIPKDHFLCKDKFM